MDPILGSRFLWNKLTAYSNKYKYVIKDYKCNFLKNASLPSSVCSFNDHEFTFVILVHFCQDKVGYAVVTTILNASITNITYVYCFAHSIHLVQISWGFCISLSFRNQAAGCCSHYLECCLLLWQQERQFIESH